MATLQQSASGKKTMGYLTPLNIETNKTKSIVVSKNQVSNISIIKTVISY
jgi:hypothetical protein